MVGEDDWAAECSNGTNVIKAAHREILSVLSRCDAVHHLHLHNTIGDINEFRFPQEANAKPHNDHQPPLPPPII